MVRVLIIIGTRLYREGLALLLDRHGSLRVVGTYAVGDEALASLETVAPDVVLLDVTLPERDEIGREIRVAAPGIPIVAIGLSGSEAEVLACAEMGAVGYVTRDASVDELVTTMGNAARGELICSPRIAGTLARRVAALGAGAALGTGGSRLTRREREIVGLIEKNLSNKEIATALCIEVATVKNHVHNLLEKLNIRSRVDASRVLRPETRSPSS